MSLGEPKIKQALDWIVARLADEPHAKRSELIDEAARQFDLTPLDEDFLFRQLVDATRDHVPGPSGG
jgi:hypothetical protein